jgi:hypothetical protein
MATPLIYAACDPVYFNVHGEAFRRSAEAHGNECKIEVLPKMDRVAYSYARFLRLPQLLKDHPAILVVDIDSVFNSHVEIPDEYDLGFFFRPWLSHPCLKVICGVTYWTDKALSFAEGFRDRLLGIHKVWGCDQDALWQQIEAEGDHYAVKRFGKDFVNYDFDQPAAIWTAKGPYRKYNPVYLERRAAYA